MNSPTENLLTAEQVAQMWGVSPQWVIDHSNGKRTPQIPRVKLGRNVRFRPQDIHAFQEKCYAASKEGARC